jgi:hypothetical protein
LRQRISQISSVTKSEFTSVAMQLRSTTRLPGRYRDDDVPDLPGTAPFVHPTVPYNPNLPPAVFPTLDFPRPVDIRTEEVMELPSRLESPESDPDQEALSKRATVFHGKQQSSDELLQRGLSSGAKSEEVAAPEPDTSRQQEWDLPDENDTDPGEYDGWGVTANDNGGDESPRIGLSVSSSNFRSQLFRSHQHGGTEAQYATRRANSILGL